MPDNFPRRAYWTGLGPASSFLQLVRANLDFVLCSVALAPHPSSEGHTLHEHHGENQVFDDSHSHYPS